MDAPDFLERLSHVEDLPTLPSIATAVVSLAAKPEVTAKNLASVIERDPALAARILRTVNSSFYGFPQKISTISQAVVLLGFRAVRNIALSLSVIDASSDTLARSGEYERYARRSLRHAVGARLIATAVGRPKDVDEAFTAGLLANLGVLVFLRYAPEEYARVLHRAPRDDDDLLDAEQETFGVDHPTVGAYMAARWDLPPVLTLAIQHHHRPEMMTDASEDVAAVARAAYLAVRLGHVFEESGARLAIQDFRREAARLTGLADEDAERILEGLPDAFEQAARIFDVPVLPGESYTEILRKANVQLAQINIDYDQMNRELQRQIDYAKRLAQQLAEANSKLEKMAITDALTQIYNFRYFREHLASELKKAERYKRSLALILLDVDHFKEVNDTFGHLAGDEVLKRIAGNIRTAIREVDVPARYGGDEFVIILPDTDLGGAEAAAERIRKRVEETSFAPPTDVNLTVTLGIAFLEPGGTKVEVQDVVATADRALYLAKQRGRNCSVSVTVRYA